GRTGAVSRPEAGQCVRPLPWAVGCGLSPGAGEDLKACPDCSCSKGQPCDCPDCPCNTPPREAIALHHLSARDLAVYGGLGGDPRASRQRAQVAARRPLEVLEEA